MVTIPVEASGLSIDIARRGKFFLTLKVGQIVSGKVISSTRDSLATLLINNKSVEVKTNLLLKPGEGLLLKVVNNNVKTGELRLSVMASGEGERASTAKGVLGAVAKGIGASRVLQSDITSFKTLLSSLDKAVVAKIPALKEVHSFLLPIEKLPAGARGGEALKEAIRTSGLFMEARLAGHAVKGLSSSAAAAGGATVKKEPLAAFLKELSGDFKGALVKLKAALKESETIDIIKLNSVRVKPEELALRVDKLIKNVEFFQIQSRLNDTLELFIPFFWKSLRDGELIFSESYKGASEGKSYSCTINLDFERSGRVSAIVLLMYDSVHLSFVAEKEEFISLIDENSGALKTIFTKLGLNLGSIRASREEKLDFKGAHKSFEEGVNVKA